MQRKGRSDPSTNISSETTTIRRVAPLTPDERDRRIAALRSFLAGSAPMFQARIDAGERGERL